MDFLYTLFNNFKTFYIMATTNNKRNANKVSNATDNAIVNVLTLDNFNFSAGLGKYIVKTPSGDISLELLNKTTGYHGGNTVYDVTCNGETYFNKVIGFYKKMFGAHIESRGGQSASVRILSDEDITNKVAAFDTDIATAFERVQKVISRVLAEDVANDLIKGMQSLLPSDIVARYRADIIEANEAKKAEKAEAEKAQAAKKAKAEKRDLAKVVVNMDDKQAELLRRLMAMDADTLATLMSKAE